MKGQYGYVWQSRPPFLGSLAIHQTPSCSLLQFENPSFLKFLIFNQKIDNFFIFAALKAHFPLEFQLFTSKFSFFSLKLQLLSLYFCQNPFFRPTVRRFAPNTHFKVECPSGQKVSSHPKFK